MSRSGFCTFFRAVRPVVLVGMLQRYSSRISLAEKDKQVASCASAQDFAREARHALQTVGTLTCHMAASAAKAQASRQHSGEVAHLTHHCTRKEAALEKAQSIE